MIWCLGAQHWVSFGMTRLFQFFHSSIHDVWFICFVSDSKYSIFPFFSAGCQSVTNVEWKNNIYKQFIVLGRKKSSSVGVKTWSRSVTQLIVTPRDSTQNDNSRSTINKRSRSQAGDEKPAKIVPFMAKKAAQEEPISRLNWNHVLISWLSAQITS